jgi:hypothetical protein
MMAYRWDEYGKNDRLKKDIGMGIKRKEKYIVEWRRRDGQEPFISDCYKKNGGKPWRTDEKHYGKLVHREEINYEDLPVECLRDMFEGGWDYLLERLSVAEVLVLGDKGLGDKPPAGKEILRTYREYMDAAQAGIEMVDPCDDSPMNQPVIGVVAEELVYNYDYGDDWHIKITGSRNCADLVESGIITQEELDGANLQCLKTYRPVMLARDGVDLVDDVGGVSGFAAFLRAIHNDFTQDNMMYEDAESSLEWAKSFGWSTRKTALKNRL